MIDFHSLTNETFRYLHTAQDTVDKLKFEDYQKTNLTFAVFVAFLDLDLDAILAREVKVGKK